MGLFDRNPGKSDASRSGDSTTPAGRVDHTDDDLFDAIDAIDVPETTQPRVVHEPDRAPETAAVPVDPADPADPAATTETVATETTAAAGTDGESVGESDVESVGEEPKPKRDIYTMSGRARPQRIEPRAAEPEPSAADDTRTEVFGAAAADPAYGVRDTDDSSPQDQNQTLAFGSSLGAAGAAGASSYRSPVPESTEGQHQVSDGTAETSMFAAGSAGAPAPAAVADGQDATVVADGDRTVVSPEDPGSAAPDSARDEAGLKRGTLDFGLLVLRIVVGALLLVRGLQTLFAFGGDPGISAFEQTLSAYNFADILAVSLPVAQIVAGGLLVFGLLTPVGSALTVVVAGFLSLHNLSIWDSGYWPYSLSPQVQFWAMVTVAGFVLTFTGPGRYSADVSRRWATRPLASAWVFAVVGVAGTVALWLAVSGGNPF